MTGQEALAEIRSLGLTVKLGVDDAIKISPKELVAPYREHLKEIIDPVRDDMIAAMKSNHAKLVSEVTAIARQRGWQAREYLPGKPPRILVKAAPNAPFMKQHSLI